MNIIISSKKFILRIKQFEPSVNYLRVFNIETSLTANQEIYLKNYSII